jgi:signal transduction histidine kinase
VRSLRFRLPAFFLVGVVLAGIVTAIITIRLFQDYTESQTVNDLRRQARELSQLFADQALQSVDEGTAPPTLVVPRLEQATGTRLYYVGTGIFPGDVSGLRRLTPQQAGIGPLPERTATIEFVPPGEDRTYLAIAEPVELLGETFGALVVAKPRAELRGRWLVLVWRVGLAFLGGLVVAALLFHYLSRRVTKPLLTLSQAADEVSRGRYDVAIPPVRSGDEIGHLTERFGEMTRRLAEASELERNFLMTVSHELRTPLTAIRGHVDVLREGLAEDPEARTASLEVVEAETERLSRLVQDLLDLAKLDANRFSLVEEEVDLQQLLDQAYQTFAEEARRRDIEYGQSVDTAPVITTDGDRVLQIVSNLLVNAFEWTPDGGQIVVELEAGTGRLAVSVADSGPGIPREDQERIFRPFWSRNGQGTGLGLAIASELATALGGRVEVESEPGRGSCFTLVLPQTARTEPIQGVRSA